MNVLYSSFCRFGATEDPVVRGGYREDAVDAMLPVRRSTKPAMQAMVRLAGFEPATYGLEVRCSIQLSYRRIPTMLMVSLVSGGTIQAAQGVDDRLNGIAR